MSATVKLPHIFGVRHLSPGGAYHLRAFLDRVQPTAVLIEGPADATEQIAHMTAKGTQPPIAILAYTDHLPVRTIYYPLAEYSPESQALVWAKEQKVHVEFIDLPSERMIALDELNGEAEVDVERVRSMNGVYQRLAELAGESDYDLYWERDFEHNLSEDAYRLAALEFGRALRELSADGGWEYERNLVREAYMRRQIARVLAAGHQAERIVVVCGAFHGPALGEVEMAGGEQSVGVAGQEKLPSTSTNLTLMPYTYFKLSTQAGYGAGNQAPAYFAMMWECLRAGDLAKLPSYYLATMASHLRTSGTYRSPAEVIEGVRLANALAALHGGSAPTLKDLRDAAVVCLGQGDLAVIAEAVARTEVGTTIGRLPEGVSRTPIQDDFYRELKRLKLDKYHSTVAMDLELDLRENRRVKSEEAAYLDLNRSFFLHRLQTLQVSFAQQKAVTQESATWAEAWVLCWTPEAEMQLVESTLRGETVELATAFHFKEQLDGSKQVGDAAKVIRSAAECGMLESMEQARATLQRLAVDSGDFQELAHAARELATVISYGDIRKFSPEHFIPLMQQIFLQATLLVVDAANCNNQAADGVITAIHHLNSVALEHFQQVDEARWISTLTELSDRDDRNPRVSGYVCAILVERSLISNEKLAGEVARRLSPGIDADLGAGWFEGLSMRNKYALLSRMSLWEQLVEYVASLDTEQFKRALVFLRRAFGRFEPGEKRQIAETLGEIWGVQAEDASDLLSRPISGDEQEVLESLNEFDFDDL